MLKKLWLWQYFVGPHDKCDTILILIITAAICTPNPIVMSWSSARRWCLRTVTLLITASPFWLLLQGRNLQLRGSSVRETWCLCWRQSLLTLEGFRIHVVIIIHYHSLSRCCLGITPGSEQPQMQLDHMFSKKYAMICFLEVSYII